MGHCSWVWSHASVCRAQVLWRESSIWWWLQIQGSSQGWISLLLSGIVLPTTKSKFLINLTIKALADYVDLITHLRNTVEGASGSPVIAFGGSYGGMLAAWIRTKYPHIVQGAIAASAPVAQFTSPCDAFGRIVTSDFSAASPNSSCSQAIR